MKLCLGESPSSSASDVDNLNNPAAVEKVALSTKCVSSPQVGSNHVIAARSRPNFVRLLNFVSIAKKYCCNSLRRIISLKSRVKRNFDFL